MADDTQPKNLYDIIEKGLWIIAVALVGISTKFILDSYGLTGVALAWVSLGIVYLLVIVVKQRTRIKQLESEEGGKRRIDELFLSQLMNNKVRMGQDLIIKPSQSRGFQLALEKGDRIETLAFSQKMFNLFLLDRPNYQKLDNAMKSAPQGGALDLTQLGIQVEFNYENVTFVKNRFVVSRTDNWVYYLTRMDKTDNEDLTVNLLISDY